jgi:hypothetical protein
MIEFTLPCPSRLLRIFSVLPPSYLYCSQVSHIVSDPTHCLQNPLIVPSSYSLSRSSVRCSHPSTMDIHRPLFKIRSLDPNSTAVIPNAFVMSLISERHITLHLRAFHNSCLSFPASQPHRPRCFHLKRLSHLPG